MNTTQMVPEDGDRVVFSNGDEGRIIGGDRSFADVEVWGTHEIKAIKWTFWTFDRGAWRKGAR